MPWLAELVDGPLTGETFQIDDDYADTPPPQITVKGCRYRYCGWRDSSPQYSLPGRGRRERRRSISSALAGPAA